MAQEISVQGRALPDLEGEWKLHFRQQRAKLIESLREAAEEHLRQQELLVDALLEKAKQDGTRRQEPDLPAFPKESTTTVEPPIAPKESIAPNKLVDIRSSSSRDTRGPAGKSLLISYLNAEMGDLTAGVLSKGKLISSESSVVSTYLQRILAFKGALAEPVRAGCLARVVTSAQFEILTFAIIAAYMIFAFWLTNQLLDNPLIVQSWGVWLAETFFLIFFVSELTVKLIVHRLFFFVNEEMGWNLLDSFIILLSVVDFALNLSSNGHSVLQDVSQVRALRLLKITKSLRIIRAVRFIGELRVLMMCIVTSFSVLVWCALLLMLIQAGVSIALVQLVVGHIQEEWSRGVHDEDLEKLVARFGSVQSSMIVLFQSTTGGTDWGSVITLLHKTGIVAPLIFGLYLIFFFVAGWNIVTSVFIEKAMTLAQPDVETQMLTKRKQDEKSVAEIIDMLEITDTDQSGTISLSEFQEYMKLPRFRQFFEFRDLEIKDVEMFFRLLSAVSDSDSVPHDVFARGCLRMKGYASVLDVQSLRIELKTTYLHQTQLFRQLSQELNSVRDQCGRHKDVQESIGGGTPSLASQEEGLIREAMQQKSLDNFKNQLAQLKHLAEEGLHQSMCPSSASSSALPRTSCSSPRGEEHCGDEDAPESMEIFGV